MTLSYKTRKRLALIILLIGLPGYVFLAITIVGYFERPSIWAEFAIYVGLGILWAVPLKHVFKGIGQPDPKDK